MPFRRWTFQLDDGPHKVELQHGFFSGKRAIRVDGRTIESTGWMRKIDTGSRHAFHIGKHACELTIGWLWEFGIGYELRVDGQVVRNETLPRPLGE